VNPVGKATVFGQTVESKLKAGEGEVDYCFDCWVAMSIRCAWCPSPIMIGDPVTLYSPTDPDFQLPEGAVSYKSDPMQVVGFLAGIVAIPEPIEQAFGRLVTTVRAQYGA
jgi:hypothetical protein